MFAVFHSSNGDRPCVVLSQSEYVNVKGETIRVADIVVFCKHGEGRNAYDSTMFMSDVEISLESNYGSVTL